MVVRQVQTGVLLEAVIEKMEEVDFKWIRKKDTPFKLFDWNKYKGEEVYKLRLLNESVILGLMCIIDHSEPSSNAIEIKLLEMSGDCIGSHKAFDYVAGCLIAFACRESFRREHEGYVFLTPKTGLIEHYVKQYGLRYFPPIGTNVEGILVADDKLSRKLIMQYLG